MRVSTTPKTRLLLAGLAALLLCAAVALERGLDGPGTAAAGAGGRPNILLFMTDDQRDRGTMRVMPATRRIFREGVRYPNAYVTTPQCCPSRATIYSGRYIHNHGIRSNHDARRFNSRETWQRHLHDAGYRTALHGKFLNEQNDGEVPYFDEFAYSKRDAEPGEGPYTHGPSGNDAFIADRTMRFILENEFEDDRPWAAVLAFNGPHSPYRVAPRYQDAAVGRLRRTPAMRERDLSDKQPRLAEAQGRLGAAEKRAGQLRLLMATDDQIERVWSLLETAGEAENTLAIFMSDNGYYWGEHGLTGKFLPYLDSLRVPMYMRWDAGGVDAGSDRRYALNIDVAPTILDAAGLSGRLDVDGRSLLDGSWERNWLLLEGSDDANHAGWPTWKYAYLDRRRHLIVWDDGFREHYDLRSDPWELENTITRPGAGRRSLDPKLKRIERKLRKASRCEGPRECP